MAELHLNDADDDFSTDPPSYEEIQFDHIVELDISLLNQAARGEHIAWALSSVMSSIMTRYGRCNGPRPSHRQRDRLFDAINSAYLTAGRILPPLCRRSTIRSGMEALAHIVAYWAAEDEQRASWDSDTYLDTCAHARIFRNMLHNISLTEEIEERAEKRRSQIITALRENALAESKVS